MADPLRQRLLKQPIVTHMTWLSPHQLSPAVNASASESIRALSKRERQSLDFCQWSFYWAFDLTFYLLFGSYAGYMKRGTDFNSIITAFVEITRGGSLLGFVPEYCDWLLASERTMTFLRKFQRFPDPTQVFLAIIIERLAKHQSSNHECSGALICIVLASKDMSNDVQHDEAVNVLFEGFFAAAVEIGVSLNSVFRCLLTNPDKCAKLVKELQTGGFNQYASCEYLTAVIKESLRMYTSNSPPFERIVPYNIHVDGYVIPKGTVVGISQYIVHRDASIYGADVEAFRPERWLEADTESKRLMERNFMPFSKGSRACAGRNLAMLELHTVIDGLMWNFEMQLTDPAKHIGTRMYWLMEFTDMNVMFTRRETM